MRLLLPLLLAAFLPLMLLGCNGDDDIPLPEDRISTPDDFDVQGHRGARGLMPENTIPGFLYAIDLGVNTIEMDVVVNADSQIVVSHEPWFHDQISLTPDGDPLGPDMARDINIFEMTMEEIREYDVGLAGHPEFPQQQTMAVTKPTLIDAIEAMEEHVVEQGLDPVRYSIEIKSREEWYDTYQPQPDEFAQLVYNELSDLGVLDRTIIQSFDVAALQAMRELDEDVPLAYLVAEEVDLEEKVEELGFTPEIFSPYFGLVDEDLMASADEHGMQVIPWTVNEVEDMQRLIDLGVHGLITDYPNRIEGRPIQFDDAE